MISKLSDLRSSVVPIRYMVLVRIELEMI